jgi:integrase
MGKSGQPHLVILSPVALAVIAEVKRQSGPYLFGKEGKTPFSGFSKAHAKLKEQIAKARQEFDPTAEGIADWRPHDMRRSFTTTLRRKGF